MEDAELVQRTLAGRTEAFEELVRRWAGRVTALCHARVGCAAAADDLAQEALLRSYRALPSLEDRARFGPWLCRIALRICLDWLKARPRRQVLFSDLTHDPESFPEPHCNGTGKHDEALDRLRAEVAGLPEDYREVVLLYYHNKVTYDDLAQMLGVSRATINVRLTRARAMLRERLCPKTAGEECRQGEKP